MLQNLKKKTEGFTIIEVLIVLVIAGLIMLIVFLAVPALQRNSRNTSRKDDASRLLAAASEWRSNNENKWPATCIPNFGCASGSANDSVRLEIASNAGDFSYFDVANFSIINGVGAAQSGDLSSSTLGSQIVGNERILLFGQANCENNTLSSGSGLAIVYPVETGGDDQAVCTGS